MIKTQTVNQQSNSTFDGKETMDIKESVIENYAHSLSGQVRDSVRKGEDRLGRRNGVLHDNNAPSLPDILPSTDAEGAESDRNTRVNARLPVKRKLPQVGPMSKRQKPNPPLDEFQMNRLVKSLIDRIQGEAGIREGRGLKIHLETSDSVARRVAAQHRNLDIDHHIFYASPVALYCSTQYAFGHIDFEWRGQKGSRSLHIVLTQDLRYIEWFVRSGTYAVDVESNLLGLQQARVLQLARCDDDGKVISVMICPINSDTRFTLTKVLGSKAVFLIGVGVLNDIQRAFGRDRTIRYMDYAQTTFSTLRSDGSLPSLNDILQKYGLQKSNKQCLIEYAAVDVGALAMVHELNRAAINGTQLETAISESLPCTSQNESNYGYVPRASEEVADNKMTGIIISEVYRPTPVVSVSCRS
jgi:hypothetical protein